MFSQKKKKKNFIFACTREKNLIIGYRINSIKMNSQLQYIFSQKNTDNIYNLVDKISRGPLI